MSSIVVYKCEVWEVGSHMGSQEEVVKQQSKPMRVPWALTFVSYGSGGHGCLSCS